MNTPRDLRKDEETDRQNLKWRNRHMVSANFFPTNSDSSSDSSDAGPQNDPASPRYPRRIRRPRQLDGYVSWDLVEHRL